jgi:hypothetical protein
MLARLPLLRYTATLARCGETIVQMNSNGAAAAILEDGSIARQDKIAERNSRHANSDA